MHRLARLAHCFATATLVLSAATLGPDRSIAQERRFQWMPSWKFLHRSTESQPKSDQPANTPTPANQLQERSEPVGRVRIASQRSRPRPNVGAPVASASASPAVQPASASQSAADGGPIGILANSSSESWLPALSHSSIRSLDSLLSPAQQPVSPGARAASDLHPAPVAGTWQEDGRYIVINLNGQQVRLLKEGASSRPSAAASATVQASASSESLLGTADGVARVEARDGGIAHGRLLHGPRPLADCRVSLIPLQGFSGKYSVDTDSEPLTTQTDAEGTYRFENVAPGPYKLYWLPKGQGQWIRRLEFKPDVVVHRRRISEIQTVRMSLRTLN